MIFLKAILFIALLHFPKINAIMSGTLVTDNTQFKYLVSLRYEDSHYCMGTILNKNTILTAARCCHSDSEKLIKLPLEKLTVVAGGLYLSKTKDTRIRKVSDMFVHERYSHSNTQAHNNDVAVWKIAGEFGEWSPNVAPIPLTSRANAEGTGCVVAGWGSNEVGSSNAVDQLRKVDISIKNYNENLADYITTFKQLGEHVLFAGDPPKDVGCGRDTGASLVCNSQISGLASFGYYCGMKPAVYTDVYAYISWINGKSSMPSSNPDEKYDDSHNGDDDKGDGGASNVFASIVLIVTLAGVILSNSL